MDSKQEEINEISSAVNELLIKVEKLKTKLDSLCKETGGCDHIKKMNREILITQRELALFTIIAVRQVRY